MPRGPTSFQSIQDVQPVDPWCRTLAGGDRRIGRAEPCPALRPPRQGRPCHRCKEPSRWRARCRDRRRSNSQGCPRHSCIGRRASRRCTGLFVTPGSSTCTSMSSMALSLVPRMATASAPSHLTDSRAQRGHDGRGSRQLGVAELSSVQGASHRPHRDAGAGVPQHRWLRHAGRPSRAGYSRHGRPVDCLAGASISRGHRRRQDGSLSWAELASGRTGGRGRQASRHPGGRRLRPTGPTAVLEGTAARTSPARATCTPTHTRTFEVANR